MISHFPSSVLRVKLRIITIIHSRIRFDLNINNYNATLFSFFHFFRFVRLFTDIISLASLSNQRMSLILSLSLSLLISFFPLFPLFHYYFIACSSCLSRWPDLFSCIRERKETARRKFHGTDHRKSYRRAREKSVSFESPGWLLAAPPFWLKRPRDEQCALYMYAL